MTYEDVLKEWVCRKFNKGEIGYKSYSDHILFPEHIDDVMIDLECYDDGGCPTCGNGHQAHTTVTITLNSPLIPNQGKKMPQKDMMYFDVVPVHQIIQEVISISLENSGTEW